MESILEPGPARLAYLDAVIGVLHGAGLLAAGGRHAFGALDSHLYGFTMQVASWPFDADDYRRGGDAMIAAASTPSVPEPARHGEHGRDRTRRVPLDFTFGLDLLLDGLERRIE